jgi:hypothetical protein
MRLVTIFGADDDPELRILALAARSVGLRDFLNAGGGQK